MLKNFIRMISLAASIIIVLSAPLTAEDTGKLLTGKCRQNLKILNDGTDKFLAENNLGLPFWGNLATIKNSLIDDKYFTGTIEPPTKDCQYFLVSNSRDDYQWYCNLHGVMEGEKTISFRYHEYRITAKTTSRYENIDKYSDHIKELLRWTEYQPTPMEKLKYHYNMNPLTTTLMGIVGIFLLIIVWRNLFY
ncbi:MAG: hypothetical protein EOM80_03250 [Erysipelotrichia bacterium]|nr:hypothetical protein [Erysipelotrichia bacterium]